MEYRFLGNSGIKVSLLSFGNWLTNDDPQTLDETIKIVKKCYDSGVNFYDTAEIYGGGEAERQFGIALKALNVPREELVVSTKIYFGLKGTDQPGRSKPNTVGTSRKHVIEGLLASLKRLQMDYVDIVYAHRYDPETPLEETCRAFNHVIQKGLAFYWGTSEWSVEEIVKAMEICDKLKLIRPIVEQPQYNMLVREKVESDYASLYEEYKLGLTVWSPLAGGILTGKYINGIPEGSRMENIDEVLKVNYYDPLFFGEHIIEKRKKTLNELNEISKELGCSLTQLALAWIISNPDVSTAILGAKNMAQIEEDLKAIEVYKKINKNILDRIEKILGTKPERKMNWKNWKSLPSRR